MSAADSSLVIAGLGPSLLVTLAVIASGAAARAILAPPSNDNVRFRAAPRLVAGRAFSGR